MDDHATNMTVCHQWMQIKLLKTLHYQVHLRQFKKEAMRANETDDHDDQHKVILIQLSLAMHVSGDCTLECKGVKAWMLSTFLE